VTDDSTAENRLRADARRNREQIVAAAHAVFVEHGVDAPLDDIAQRAGVGIGTLYRRFPDRTALIHAVCGDNLHRLVELARTELEQDQDAWGSLSRFLRRCVELRLGGLFSALGKRLIFVIREDEELRAARQAMLSMLDRMVLEAQSDGVMRADIGTGDIIYMLGMVIRQNPEMQTQHAEEARRRMLEILLDGLRVHPGSPLPGVQLTAGYMTLNQDVP
jgi:AcrR family transcriptional regulator